jgi:hypothetical protein
MRSSPFILPSPLRMVFNADHPPRGVYTGFSRHVNQVSNNLSFVNRRYEVRTLYTHNLYESLEAVNYLSPANRNIMVFYAQLKHIIAILLIADSHALVLNGNK